MKTPDGIYSRLAILPLDLMAMVESSDNRPSLVAAAIQHEGFLNDVSPNLVTQLIARYRKYLISEEEKMDSEKKKSTHAPFDPLVEIQRIAELQKARVDRFLTVEKDFPAPMEAVGKAIDNYQTTLALMQRMQIEAKTKSLVSQENSERVSSLRKVLDDMIKSEQTMNREN